MNFPTNPTVGQIFNATDYGVSYRFTGIMWTSTGGSSGGGSGGSAALPIVDVIPTSQLASAGTHYVLVNVAATTVTLPANPTIASVICVTPANSLLTNLIDPNGKTIQGVAGVMTIDRDATITMQYLAGTWRFI